LQTITSNRIDVLELGLDLKLHVPRYVQFSFLSRNIVMLSSLKEGRQMKAEKILQL